jgi:hypothetical protein
VDVSTAEMQGLLDKLEDFLDEVEALIAFLDEHPSLTRQDKKQARGLLSHLKKRLKAEHRRTSTVKAQASLSWREQSYYVPAVHAAYGSLTIRTNSVPGTAWIHDLMSAQIDLDFYAEGLRELLGK